MDPGAKVDLQGDFEKETSQKLVYQRVWNDVAYELHSATYVTLFYEELGLFPCFLCKCLEKNVNWIF